MIYKIVLSYLLPVTIAATTPFISQPNMPTGVGESRLTSYLEASYVPSTVYTPQEAIEVAFGEDSPTMLKIAQCESKTRQWDEAGDVITNHITHDYGIFQINEIHLPEAKRMGIDVFSLQGNIDFAAYLFHAQHTLPWQSSHACSGV